MPRGRVIYEPRDYRTFEHGSRFTTFRVNIETTDLYVRAGRELLPETEKLIRQGRNQVEAAIARRPEFLTSLVPLEEDESDAPLAFRMIRAARKADVGPMAAVAGAIAEYVGMGLLAYSEEVIVENGGDIFLKIREPITVGVYAGASPLSGKIGVRLQGGPLPIGVCTSSATVGPSLSLGRGDAATVIAKDTALADACASGLGNRIRKAADLKDAVDWAMSIQGVDAALAVLGDSLAAKGDIELTPL